MEDVEIAVTVAADRGYYGIDQRQPTSFGYIKLRCRFLEIDGHQF